MVATTGPARRIGRATACWRGIGPTIAHLEAVSRTGPPNGAAREVDGAGLCNWFVAGVVEEFVHRLKVDDR